MSSAAVAENYAQTLLEIATKQDAAEPYGDLLGEIVAIYQAEEDFRSFLETPRIPLREKKKVLAGTLGDQVPELFVRFLLVVMDKGRQRSLPSIERAYRDLLDERAGRVHATVSLAFTPDETFQEELAAALSEQLGAKVVPHFREDERIIGGVVVRVGDHVMDGSLRRRLDDLKAALTRSEDLGRTL